MRRFRKIAFWAAALVCFLALIWAGSTSYYQYQFEARVDAVRVGVRVDLASFNRPPIPDLENAAVVLREGMDWCEECELDLDRVTSRWEVADRSERDKAWDDVVRVITALRPWYMRIERAAAMQQCRFDVDHTKLLNPDIAPHRTTRFVNDSLDWRVRERVLRDGSVPQSIRDCETLLQWSALIEPVSSLSYATHKALVGTACGMIQRVSAQRGFIPGFARQRLEPYLIAAEHDEDRLRDAVDYDFVASIAATRLWNTWDGSRELTKLLARLAAVDASDSEQILHPKPDYGVMLLAALRRPLIWRSGAREFSVWKEGAGILFRDDAKTLPDLAALRVEHEWGRVPFTSSAGALQRLQKIRLQLRDHIRITRLGLAALEYRQLHGAWPESPAALAPLFPEGVPVNPFTREPYVFDREDERIFWLRK